MLCLLTGECSRQKFSNERDSVALGATFTWTKFLVQRQEKVTFLTPKRLLTVKTQAGASSSGKLSCFREILQSSFMTTTNLLVGHQQDYTEISATESPKNTALSLLLEVRPSPCGLAWEKEMGIGWKSRTLAWRHRNTAEVLCFALCTQAAVPQPPLTPPPLPIH